MGTWWRSESEKCLRKDENNPISLQEASLFSSSDHSCMHVPLLPRLSSETTKKLFATVYIGQMVKWRINEANASEDGVWLPVPTWQGDWNGDTRNPLTQCSVLVPVQVWQRIAGDPQSVQLRNATATNEANTLPDSWLTTAIVDTGLICFCTQFLHSIIWFNSYSYSYSAPCKGAQDRNISEISQLFQIWYLACCEWWNF